MDEKEIKSKVSIRIPKDLREKILEEAKNQKRNETNMITVILEEYFENIDRIKKISAKK